MTAMGMAPRKPLAFPPGGASSSSQPPVAPAGAGAERAGPAREPVVRDPNDPRMTAPRMLPMSDDIQHANWGSDLSPSLMPYCTARFDQEIALPANFGYSVFDQTEGICAGLSGSWLALKMACPEATPGQLLNTLSSFVSGKPAAFFHC